MQTVAEQVGQRVNNLMREFNIITNNLANVSTVGYKRRCNTFSQLLDAQIEKGKLGSESKNALEPSLDFSQGTVVETGRKLDFALNGKGFFEVETGMGPLYTRNGMFRTNANGQIVDSNGYAVSGANGPITIPKTVGLSQLHVAADGNISADGAVIGKFKIVDFKDEQANLIPVGGSCFKAPKDVDTEVAKNTVVKQGYHEASNVKLVEELVDMIMVQRLYEANMKLIHSQKGTGDSLMSVAMG